VLPTPSASATNNESATGDASNGQSPELQAVPVVLQMAVAGAASDSGGAANEGWWSYQGSVVELQSSAATVAREQQ
jgi:hypothetical protein